jgi:glycerol-3-phosphate dehydrogenase
MKRNFENLAPKTFDLIVVGGGIIGTGVARDAALRGLDVLLVEKEDFACGTTSRSTRLIHGGLRYLRMLELKLVRQDLHEREVLLHIAPHLVNRLSFTIPLLRSKPFFRASLPFGLLLYDILAAGKSLPSRQHLSREKTLEMEPALAAVQGLLGSYLYYDCQARNMERLCLENALGAAEKGACVLNHTEATDFIYEQGEVKGIRLRDKINNQDYTARGRFVLNASGPWANLVLNQLDLRQRGKIQLTKGIHLVTRKLANQALVLFAKSDGRLFFIIPWHDWSLIGTTDTHYTGAPDNVRAEKEDVDYLVTETSQYFPGFKMEDIYYAMAGLRPLADIEEKAESRVSRAHRLIDHEKEDQLKGFISILGGKITAYRAIAEEAVDLVCHKLKLKELCQTAQTPLPGAPALSQEAMVEIAVDHKLPAPTVSYLADIYGSRIYQVLKYVSEDHGLAGPMAPGYPDIRAQIKHAVLEEEALTVNDFLFRRSLLGLRPDQGQAAVEVIAQSMAGLLKWSSVEKQNQIRNYTTAVAISQSFRQGAV